MFAYTIVPSKTDYFHIWGVGIKSGLVLDIAEVRQLIHPHTNKHIERHENTLIDE